MYFTFHQVPVHFYLDITISSIFGELTHKRLSSYSPQAVQASLQTQSSLCIIAAGSLLSSNITLLKKKKPCQCCCSLIFVSVCEDRVMSAAGAQRFLSSVQYHHNSPFAARADFICLHRAVPRSGGWECGENWVLGVIPAHLQ